MGGSDKALGGAMLLVAGVVFSYYTTWAMLLPFFDASNPLHNWFPPREWAVRLPAFILVVGMSGIGFFLGTTMMKEKKRKAQQAKARAA
ncbi:dolichol phosphate-mannose biosynthesis regulatory [Crepidotus variabilis]|uniref:Dolichol phosphate-mannose biosynthesis regulatory protein n=1 Tax=Crepidotus variabilis TaxID=179855 RepID=A0A9P6EPI0_9AGAR|nr:dolichol phosphate-mannose biosynthesis regulatory [Crepidotus variabilis]